jgi:Zn-dependent protease
VHSHFNLGKLFGIRIGVHASWLLIAFLIAFSLGDNFHLKHPEWSYPVVALVAILTAILFFVCLVLHELAHSLVAQSKGIPVQEITLFALGGVSQMTEEPKNAASEFEIAIVGPLTSAVLGALCLLAAYLLSYTHQFIPAAQVFTWLGYINLALAVFNLLPGYPMDGGRVLRAILWWRKKNLLRATRLAVRISSGVATSFILVGILFFFRGAGIGGLWLAFIGWFLLQAARESYLSEEARQSLTGVTVSDLMLRELPRVDRHTSLQSFVSEQLLHSTSRYFLVTREGLPIGILTPAEITHVEERMWPFTEVEAVMLPIASMPSLEPDAPAMKALEMMRTEHANPVPVIANGQLRGILSRRSMAEYLQTLLELHHTRASR